MVPLALSQTVAAIAQAAFQRVRRIAALKSKNTRKSGVAQDACAFRPTAGLVRIDPGLRQRAICQSHQSLRNGAFGAMRSGQKHARRFADAVGNHCAPLQFEFERGTDRLLWDLKQLFGQEHLLVDRQPQWPSFVASPRAQDSISRTAFCSAQAARILAARIGPMPFTSRRRSGVISMMSKTSCRTLVGHRRRGF
jgi:hypothetical protein